MSAAAKRSPFVRAAQSAIAHESGVYRKVEAPRTFGVAEVLFSVREIIPSGAVCVFLAPGQSQGARAIVDPSPRARLDHGFTLEMRLASWLSALDKARALNVPEYMKEWMPVRSVVAMPLRTPVWLAGVVVVETSALDRASLHAFEDLAATLAVRLESEDRKAQLRVLQRVG